MKIVNNKTRSLYSNVNLKPLLQNIPNIGISLRFFKDHLYIKSKIKYI